MAKFKIPKKIKLGLKVFGMCACLITTLNSVSARISGKLPVSTISDEFPTTYQAYIDKLKEIYPNAMFKAVYTGLDWNTVLKHECYEVNKKISTIPSSYDAGWKMNGTNTYIDGYFVAASKSGVAYVLDPRNGLYEKTIFQFEGLSYNLNITPEVIEKVIVSSPMVGAYSKKYKNANNWIDMDMSYAEIIDKVGKEQGVSSVYIASRMIQETAGDIVNNGSINGSNATYPGVYNFFNIGATPNSDGSGAVLNGLKYAAAQKWTTPYLSISGGVEEIKSSYIKYGQDTVYFQKFDVNNPYGNASALMAYQYQTNIMAPTSESKISYNAYKKLDMLDTAFTFYIPVYNNMPEDPAPYPAGDSAKFVADNTKVYLDDGLDNGEDKFNIRSSASSELDNIIYVVTETKSGADNRTILTRTKLGDGYDWDYVELEVDGKMVKGYIWKEFVKEYEYVKVEGVTLDKTEITLEIDETCTLKESITPTEAEFKDVIWSVQDETVASVIDGVVTAKAQGTTVVTVTTKDGGKVATCNITVIPKTYDITLDKAEYIIEEEEFVTPEITLKNIESYEMKILDETIACVVDGNIKGMSQGETVLEVRAKDSDIVVTAKIIVNKKICEITLDSEEYSIKVDEVVTPVVTLKNIESYEMKILDETIACVVDGNIKGMSQGETVLEVRAKDSDVVVTAKILVTQEIIEEGYKLNETLILNVENKFLTNITPETKVSSILPLIELTNLKVKIEDINGNKIEEDKNIGTGTRIVFSKLDETIYDTLTIVVCGEVTGDGLINSADLLKTVKYLKGTTDINIQAADVTKDGVINSADLLKTVKYLKGTATIDFK